MASLMNCGSDERVKNIIDIYPEELLLKIFGLLDSASVKNLTLVNKRCYEIVTNETVTMKNLPLVIHDDILRKKHLTVANLKSKFYKVLFDSIQKTFNKNMLSSLKTIGSNIREVEFIQCSVKEPKEYNNILCYFPKVEKLSFNSCSFRNLYKESDDQVLELENLKELVIKQSCLTVLSFFKAQLKSLKVNSSAGHRNEEQLMEFLYTQKRLETLALRTITSSTAVFAKKPDKVYQFKLKELSLRKISFEDRFEDENLIDFLHTQKDSVEILELGRTFSNNVYELILNKFTNIKTLRIDIAAFPADLSFYKKIKANRNVTKLMIYGDNEDIAQYCAILSLFPNVNDIRFSSQVPLEVISCLPKCCSALNILSLDSLRSGNYNKVKFPALKNFHLDWLENQCEWMHFVIANPAIESLSFKWVFEQMKTDPRLFGKALKIVCSSLPYLKHLKIGGYMNDYIDKLREIMEVCTNLETMDVLEDDIDVGKMPVRSGFKFRCYDRASVKFIFPTHGPIWKDDIGDNDTEDDELHRNNGQEDWRNLELLGSDTDDDDDSDDDIRHNNNYDHYY